MPSTQKRPAGQPPATRPAPQAVEFSHLEAVSPTKADTAKIRPSITPFAP